MDRITGSCLAARSDMHFMEMALEEAWQAAREGEIPVGAVLVRDRCWPRITTAGNRIGMPRPMQRSW